ncbi:MAG: NADH-quinone oxidoreductase subunit A [Candidatus Marsarchaeota archaeon]|nr:NADH-quinone oxidoreductase subunit A [Candidatus Marsarchaeota archaeon]MCL5412856.1 NADH-quinone oxidoreductase subunit A [Candidatus Marsarchaeota archaeon]
MDINVVAIVIFIIFSTFTPVSLVITSIFLRRQSKRNAMMGSPYESAEESRGNRISIMNEYMHYFSMFLSFEILVAVAIVWAPIARLLPTTASAAVLSLLVAGMVFEVFVMLIARSTR